MTQEDPVKPVRDLFSDAIRLHLEARQETRRMRPRIARAIGAIFMGMIVLIFVGLLVHWFVAFIGMTTLAFYTLTRLHMEAKDAT